MQDTLGLYLHIPFCVQKCAYCDFLSGPQDAETIDKYVRALEEEILSYGESEEAKRRIDTVFFGGGTPSVLESRQMHRIFDALHRVFDLEEDAEITIEANPGTVTREKLETYLELGINRISFGLQSANEEELKILGRIHTYEEFLESYFLARTCGFANINVDLISAIPKQSIESLEETLRKVLALEPEHISAYSLIIEEGTPFANLYGEGKEKEGELPSEEEERRMYERTDEMLSEFGYNRYEISNYAKAGRECRHNLRYWDRADYLGLGLGSSSMVENVRFKNTDDMKAYLSCAGDKEKFQEEREVLSVVQQMEETIFLGLRKMEGISLAKFEQLFGQTVQACFGANAARMQGEGLLTVEDGYLRLTKRGIDVSNYVFVELLT